MTTLTDAQIADFRGDLGDDQEQQVFSANEFQRFYDRANSDYNRAVLYAIDQLLMNTAKMQDYQTAHGIVDSKEVHERLLNMREIWEKRITDQVTQSSAIIRAPVTAKRRYREQP